MVSTYKSLREQGLDNFEFILIGSDQTNRKMQEYMVSSGMEWPAVRFNRRNDRMLRQFGGRGIPCVAVADRNGRVLFHSYRGQEYLGPMDPLEKFIQVVYLTQRVGQQRSDPASQQVPQ
ncbi:MAG: hypothetical protein LR015_05355 [Verrucomicrobia bacterium]|nr:hypothetical protein [Verrucomicrobiota bacterium]